MDDLTLRFSNSGKHFDQCTHFVCAERFKPATIIEHGFD
ncbi:MAG: hypothetical protein ACI9DC_005515, partial [Gammaproteobacteria bacterium]